MHDATSYLSAAISTSSKADGVVVDKVLPYIKFMRSMKAASSAPQQLFKEEEEEDNAHESSFCLLKTKHGKEETKNTEENHKWVPKVQADHGNASKQQKT